MKLNICFLVLFLIIVFYGKSQEIKGRTQTGSVYISKDPPKPADLVFTENSLQFTDKDGNNMIDADENCIIKFQLKNNGTGDGINLKALITEKNNISGLQFSKSKELGNLKPGQNINVEIPVTGSHSLMEGTAVFNIKIDELNGFVSENYVLELKTRKFQEPSVKINDYSITSDAGTSIQYNKSFDLQVLVQNKGMGTAENVELGLKIPENIFLISSNPLENIGTLLSGVSRVVNYTLTIPRSYQATTIPLHFTLKEEYGKYGEIKDITLEMNQSVSANKLVVEGIEKQAQVIQEASFTSDVDKNIPANGVENSHKYALIFGNENYSLWQPDLNTEVNVDYAKNDAKIFRQYCVNTLGVPDKQAVFIPDATSAKMKSEIAKINLLIENEKGNAEIIFYYSGHGMPDELTKEPYLMPVDVSGNNIQSGIKLQEVYDKLTEFPAKKVTVIIDACFSGGARNKPLAQQKSIKTHARQTVIKGNTVVLTSSQGAESSGVYREKMHGYFTYYLLKKLQETKGDINYKDLSEYLKQAVNKESILSGKPQTPDVQKSPEVEGVWESWKLK